MGPLLPKLHNYKKNMQIRTNEGKHKGGMWKI